MHCCCAGEENLHGSTSGPGFLRPAVRALHSDSFTFDTKYYRVYISASRPHFLSRMIVMAQAHITAKKQHG